MSAAAPPEDVDAEHTRMEHSGPATWRESGKVGRGSVLAGKYRLETLLGQGGMAFVWSAYNLELELPVALKLLKTGAKSERLAERLRFEARAAARLVHPSIVRVFDIGMAENGDPFIVMELLTGESLAELLARGRVSATRGVQLLLPIAEALALSHAKGIVHRDLKPDNVFLSTDAEQLQPKLLDFGIAKLEQASASLDKLTEKGTALGSPQYMSPEQVSGGDVDHRSDIWSFCVVLYKAITGSCPFVGPDRRSTMDAIIENEPARLTAGAGVDPQLARLVHWGLAKDPLQRPTSIRELGRQLAQWLLGQGISDDASGAPLAAKWLTHVPEPSMRRPPPLDDRALTLPPAATQSPADEATARVAFVPLAVRVTAAAERSRGRSRSSRRRWVLPLAASVLVIAGSAGVWLRSATSSATESSLAAPMARAAPASKQLTAPAPLVLAAAPQQQLPLSEPPDADARSEESPTAESAVIPQADRPLRAPIAQPKSSRAGPRPTPSQLPF